MTEDEMVGWHHRLNGHEFEQALGDSEGQGSLMCCSPLGLQRVRHNLATENKNRREVETWMKVREGMESPPSSLLAAVGGEQISLS